MAAVQAYRLFNVVLARKRELSPSMLCCTFSGEELRQIKIDAPDQRIKLLLPSLSGKPSRLINEEVHWWERVCAMPTEDRPILRTYTLRNVNAEAGEIDVEFVMHGTEGPASAWALGAQPGDSLQIAAPNRAHEADSGGYEWAPHPQVQQALVVADETALPAAKAIIEQLAGWPQPPQVQLFVEMPARGDWLDLSEYPFVEAHWLAREHGELRYGEALLAAVKEHVRLPEQAQVCQDVREEGEGELLWDRAASDNRLFHGWVAAESSAVKHLRRYLIGERGLAQETISFMAYWSQGPRRK
ncbi:siderophore-interacting protein [Erwinia sp. E602]|uniref:siderophore-interacting protein n=1 Tax=unclassified Erwinia TaxID=2622719 RepID=UPI0006F26461|nr:MULTISPECIES: siderophore-interacting protein [unclassified Erwinia]KQN53757.1 iron utilization protein [Erwinia sp. Leaf53]QUG73868.1 siderophore-interacting protein [Erwinia sp. E602]